MGARAATSLQVNTSGDPAAESPRILFRFSGAAVDRLAVTEGVEALGAVAAVQQRHALAFVVAKVRHRMNQMLAVKIDQRLDRGRMVCQLVGVEPGQEFELSREHVLTAFATRHTISR